MRKIIVSLIIISLGIFAKHVTNYDNFRKVKIAPQQKTEVVVRLDLEEDTKPLISELNFEEKYDLKVKSISLADTTDKGLIAGFRVQVFKIDDFKKAKFKEELYINKFGEEKVFLIFEKPFYKLRIGSFLSKAEAENFQEELSLQGIKNSIIIPDLINVNLIEKK